MKNVWRCWHCKSFETSCQKCSNKSLQLPISSPKKPSREWLHCIHFILFFIPVLDFWVRVFTGFHQWIVLLETLIFGLIPAFCLFPCALQHFNITWTHTHVENKTNRKPHDNTLNYDNSTAAYPLYTVQLHILAVLWGWDMYAMPLNKTSVNSMLHWIIIQGCIESSHCIQCCIECYILNGVPLISKVLFYKDSATWILRYRYLLASSKLYWCLTYWSCGWIQHGSQNNGSTVTWTHFRWFEWDNPLFDVLKSLDEGWFQLDPQINWHRPVSALSVYKNRIPLDLSKIIKFIRSASNASSRACCANKTSKKHLQLKWTSDITVNCGRHLK